MILSSAAQKSFHGTSISIFQYPEKDEQIPNFVMEKDLPSQAKVQLPPSYTRVLPAKDFKPEPTNRKPHDEHTFLNQTSIGIEKWLDKTVNMNFAENEDRINFASFFSARTQKEMPRTSSTLMPLLDDSINSSDIVRHRINLISKLINHLNPGQVAIITADQPVFAIGKQVEWRYPDKFKDMVWMLGHLHIEVDGFRSWRRQIFQPLEELKACLARR